MPIESSSARSTVAVLVRDDEDRPGQMEEVEKRADVRYVVDVNALRTALSRAHVLFVWDFTSEKVRAAWDGVSDALSWVHVASTGVDPVLFPELVRSDTTLTNSREIFDGAIAEYVAGTVLALYKDLPRTLRMQQQRVWEHRETLRLAGARAVVVGTGPIGRAIGRLLGALGCAVDGVARRERQDDPDFGVIVGADDIDSILPGADIVVSAVPLTPGTRGLFDADRFARMKPAALFVNVGRGPVVVEDALVRTLRDGRLGGAVLDVFADEPLPSDHPLWSMEHVIVSPHMAGDFVGWRDVLARTFADNFLRWHGGRPLENVVDKHLGYVPG